MLQLFVSNFFENNIKTINSDLSILNADLFSFTKFEKPRPCKMIENILCNSYTSESSNIKNISAENLSLINKNFLKCFFISK